MANLCVAFVNGGSFSDDFFGAGLRPGYDFGCLEATVGFGTLLGGCPREWHRARPTGAGVLDRRVRARWGRNSRVFCRANELGD